MLAAFRQRRALAFILAWNLCGGAFADEASDESWAIHGQATFVLQANAKFRSPYRGAEQPGLAPAREGKLPHPGPEEIVEAYYDLAVAKPLHVSFDGQLINHPRYNRDRGPIAVGAVRLHSQF